ncbi:hypothetical protein [Salipiger mangrovisoli]|uniref:Lipoprotein n=1 Tax=Salipiger mangrovisoli TaxID=2865933 RepID=A0ABR9X381_9RHOB|nr:hypothetical protein [Salipiger mangrovisoli]MBE9638022.1 hypothetical protein [Salipiger mangrovisoli]
MFKPVSALMISALVLGGCVGQDETAPVSSETGANNPLIPERSAVSFFAKKEEVYLGQPVGMITELLLERRPGGFIVRVSGVADFAGPFDVQLVPVAGSEDTGTLAFRLLALQVPGPVPAGAAARTVTAAKWMTDKELAPYRALRVEGLRNSQSVSR